MTEPLFLLETTLWVVTVSLVLRLAYILARDLIAFLGRFR